MRRRSCCCCKHYCLCGHRSSSSSGGRRSSSSSSGGRGSSLSIFVIIVTILVFICSIRIVLFFLLEQQNPHYNSIFTLFLHHHDDTDDDDSGSFNNNNHHHKSRKDKEDNGPLSLSSSVYYSGALNHADDIDRIQYRDNKIVSAPYMYYDNRTTTSSLVGGGGGGRSCRLQQQEQPQRRYDNNNKKKKQVRIKTTWICRDCGEHHHDDDDDDDHSNYYESWNDCPIITERNYQCRSFDSDLWDPRQISFGGREIKQPPPSLLSLEEEEEEDGDSKDKGITTTIYQQQQTSYHTHVLSHYDLETRYEQIPCEQFHHCWNLKRCTSTNTTTSAASSSSSFFTIYAYGGGSDNHDNNGNTTEAYRLLQLAIKHYGLIEVSDPNEACIVLITKDSFRTTTTTTVIYDDGDHNNTNNNTNTTTTTTSSSSSFFVTTTLQQRSQDEQRTILRNSIQDGSNHIAWNVHSGYGGHGDRPFNTNVNYGRAIMAIPTYMDANIRLGYDIPTPLYHPSYKLPMNTIPPVLLSSSMETTQYNNRKRPILVSFKGNICPWKQVHWQHRWLVSEYWNTTEEDVVVDVVCEKPFHRNNKLHSILRKKQQRYEKTSYNIPYNEYVSLLHNSTYTFCPGGGSTNSYRFVEALSMNSIPIVTPDFVPPMIPEYDWSKCIVRMSESRIIDIPRILRTNQYYVSPVAIQRRQKHCQRLFRSIIGLEKVIMTTTTPKEAPPPQEEEGNKNKPQQQEEEEEDEEFYYYRIDRGNVAFIAAMGILIHRIQKSIQLQQEWNVLQQQQYERMN